MCSSDLWPGATVIVIAVLVAIWLLVSGVFEIVRAFAHGLSGGMRALLLITADHGNAPGATCGHCRLDERGSLVERSISTVVHALGEASLLVVVLLFLFLGNLRASLVVAVTLPFAALITFFVMRQYGMSANLMSLGGLAIAIGLMVDGILKLL